MYHIISTYPYISFTFSYSAASSGSCTNCPVGYSCVNGVATVCPSGSYQTATGQSSCIACPSGYFCTGGSNEQACATGSYSSGSAGSWFDDNIFNIDYCLVSRNEITSLSSCIAQLVLLDHIVWMVL